MTVHVPASRDREVEGEERMGQYARLYCPNVQASSPFSLGEGRAWRVRISRWGRHGTRFRRRGRQSIVPIIAVSPPSVVYLQPADKYRRLTRRPSTGSKRLRRAGSHGIIAALSPLVTPSTRAVWAHDCLCRAPPSAASHHYCILTPCRLWPGWHTKQQHFAQRPDMVRQSRRHGWRTGPPLFGRARPMGGRGCGNGTRKLA